MHWSGMALKPSPPWKLMFLGTDHFATKILSCLHADLLKQYLPSGNDGVLERLDVVTKPSQGAVRNYLSDNPADIKHYTWPDVDIRPGEFDVGVVASFGHLLPKSFIELFPYGILNVHPSLLPRWRGCAPIPYTILAGDKITGVTIQQIQPYRFDVGPIVNQRELAVPPDITSMQLFEMLAALGADLLMETLRDLPHLEDIEVDQDDRLATYAHKIKRNDDKLMIDWNNESCKQIDRKFRAFSELHDLRTYYGEYKVRLRKPVARKELQWYTLRDPKMVGHPGCAAYINQKDCLAIQCEDGLVGIREITVKKHLSAKSFYNGYLSKPHWKYTKFSNKIEADGPTKPKVMTSRRRMAFRKHWELQLLRMNSLPADG